MNGENIDIFEILKKIQEEIKETRKNSSEHTQDLEQINKSIIKISDILENEKDSNKWKNRNLNEYDRIILKNLESRISILEENKETYKIN